MSYKNLPSEIQKQLYDALSNQEALVQAESMKPYDILLKDDTGTTFIFSVMKVHNEWKVLVTKKIEKILTKKDLTRIKKKQNAFTYNVIQLIMNYIYPEQTVPPLRELIQNSVDENSQIIYVDIKVKYMETRDWTDHVVESITVEDDGNGMDINNITDDLLIPTMSSKRQQLFYLPSMAISRKTYEKIGIFGLGFFSFLGIMHNVYILTRKNVGRRTYYFINIEVEKFLKEITSPDYDRMILPIPATTTDMESLDAVVDEWIAEKHTKRQIFNDETVRDILHNLWDKFANRSQGTIIFGTNPNYEEKERVLRSPEKLEEVVRYLGDFLKLKRPEIDLFINNNLVRMSRGLRQFTEAPPIIIEKVQDVPFKDRIEPITRRIDVWAKRIAILEPFTIITGGIPIEFDLTYSSDDSSDVAGLGGNMRGIYALVPVFKVKEKDIEYKLDYGLHYHFIVDCNFIDLNIGRDKIIKNESFTFFKEMLGDAVMIFNDRVFPNEDFERFLTKKEEEQEETPPDLFLRRLYSYYIYNTKYLENEKYEALVKTRVPELRIFEPMFRELLLGGLNHSLKTLTSGNYDTIYLIPREINLDKPTKKMLKDIHNAGGVAIIELPSRKESPLLILNVFADIFVEKQIEMLYLDPRGHARIDYEGLNISLPIKTIKEVVHTDYISKTQKPVKVFEEDDPDLTQTDIDIMQHCEDLVAYIVEKFKEFWTEKIRKALGLFSLWDLIDEESELALTSNERKTLARFFGNDHEVQIVWLPEGSNAIAVWYEGKMEAGQWKAGWIGINKRSSAYIEMLLKGIYEHPMELIAYLSSIIAHEIAHAKALKILVRFLLKEQSPVHYSKGYVNAREVAQDITGEFLAKLIRKERKARAKRMRRQTAERAEELLTMDKFSDPFENEIFCCVDCKAEMTYLGALEWHCPTCNVKKQMPPRFLLNSLVLYAKRIMNQ